MSDVCEICVSLLNSERATFRVVHVRNAPACNVCVERARSVQEVTPKLAASGIILRAVQTHSLHPALTAALLAPLSPAPPALFSHLAQ